MGDKEQYQRGAHAVTSSTYYFVYRPQSLGQQLSLMAYLPLRILYRWAMLFLLGFLRHKHALNRC